LVDQRQHVFCLIAVCGLALALGAGCGKKTLDVGASGKAFIPPPKGGPVDVAGRSKSVGEAGGQADQGGGGQGLSHAGSGSDPAGSGSGLGEGSGPGAGNAMGPGTGPGGTEGDPSSFPSLAGSRPGGKDDRNAGEIIVANAEPSDAARRQAEQIQKDQLATALADLNDVFFLYDSWKLTEDAKAGLERDAAWLKANPTKTLTIEGYCDERGTSAYNLVLGERRAKAARDYLIELGVEPGRLTTVSYGKERPFCTEHEEACYKQNRRAHLVLRLR
jgi:peptidoglycan-associated lipoprotein